MTEFMELPVFYSEVKVKDIIENLKNKFKIKLLTPSLPLDTVVNSPDLNRPALLFTGFEEIFLYDRLQIIGESEIRVLNSFSSKKRREIIKKFFSYPIPAVFITKGFFPPEGFLQEASNNLCPVFSVSYSTTPFMRELFYFLALRLSPWTVLHGNAVNVYGAGVLFVGRSGIGKSECSLDLVKRGHRLVADDLVLLMKHPENFIIASAYKKDLHSFIEIRGIGIMDVKTLYGTSASIESTKLDVCIKLIDWSETLEVERIGLKENIIRILGISIPYIEIPLNPGKNVSVLIESVALNIIAKKRGYSAPEIFLEKIKEK
jgi:HPr kinase/phosphorylase